MTEIRTERLLLRRMRSSDLSDLHAVFSNAEVMKYWSTLPHSDPAQTAALIKQTIDASPETTADFAIEYQGRVIGKAGFWNMPEIGYLLHPDFWRQGFGTEALQALIAYGFGDRKLDHITADVAPGNDASIRLLKKQGFIETGREQNTLQIGDDWYDSVYFELRPPLQRF